MSAFASSLPPLHPLLIAAGRGRTNLSVKDKRHFRKKKNLDIQIYIFGLACLLQALKFHVSYRELVLKERVQKKRGEMYVLHLVWSAFVIFHMSKDNKCSQCLALFPNFDKSAFEHFDKLGNL